MFSRTTMSSDATTLKALLEAANAEIARQAEENAMLRHQLNTQRTNATINVEAKMKAMQLSDEFDFMFEHLNLLKQKYNKLQAAYTEKVKRCRSLEDTFQRQKTLTGLVMKSAVEQRLSEQKLMHERRLTAHVERSEKEQLQLEVSRLEAALNESYNIIDDLEFEVESIDLLEMQNQTLRSEIAALKANREPTAPPAYSSLEHLAEPQTEEAAAERRNYRKMVATTEFDNFFRIDDADSETLERAALTNSLVENAEAESNCLRRELLRSRLQNTIKPKKSKAEQN